MGSKKSREHSPPLPSSAISKPSRIASPLPPLLPVLPPLNILSLVEGTGIPPPQPSPPASPPGNPLSQNPITAEELSSVVSDTGKPKTTTAVTSVPADQQLLQKQQRDKEDDERAKATQTPKPQTRRLSSSRPQTSPLPSPTVPRNRHSPSNRLSLFHPLSPTSTRTAATAPSSTKRRLSRLFSFRSFSPSASTNTSSDSLPVGRLNSPLATETLSDGSRLSTAPRSTSRLAKRRSVGWFRKVSLNEDMIREQEAQERMQEEHENMYRAPLGNSHPNVPPRNDSPPPQLQLSSVVLDDAGKEDGGILGAEDLFKSIK